MALPDVLILAAGRGERLRPLTDATPKPLLRVGAKTLIEHHLTRLRAQGFAEVVVNLAHLGEQVRAHLGDGARFGLRVRYSEEPPGALETGGGIVRALALLRSDPFIVINGDILSDFDYASLRVPPRRAMHLVLVENPPHHPRGDFALQTVNVDSFGIEHGTLALSQPDDGRSDDGCNDDGRNGNARNRGARNWTYAGIACFRRSAFDDALAGRFPLRPLIERAIAEHRASAEIHRGQWLDVGAPDRLEQARREFG
ncbi:MAG: nucleotidyltransferase family protein [bacterium]